MALRDTTTNHTAAETTEPPVPVRSRDEPSYRILSMFSGCGGLDLGFEGGFEYRGIKYPRLNTTIVAAYDNDRKAKRTYDKNFGQSLTLTDLAKASVSEMPPADILIGGFPCQEFSICGPQGGVSSRRGGLFRAMSRYASLHQPKMIVAENVAHIERINGGEDLRTIRTSLTRAGYRINVWPVYAPDFGVPQTRRRIIIVGVHKSIIEEITSMRPTHEEHKTTKWAIDDLKGVLDESIPNQSQYFKAALAKQGHGQGDETTLADQPAYTIRANSRSRVQFHYELPRRLTVRECARIQTFPDSFVFPDEATPSIRQIGNAVPPVLAHCVATHILNFLARAENNNR